MDAATFYLSGLLSLVAAFLVVTRRNPVFSAIWLVCFFVTISIDFLILRAPFLAVIQVLVYAGAIMVLFLFVIMLLNLRPGEIEEAVTRGRKAGSAALAGGIFIVLCAAISRSPAVKGAASLTAPLPAGHPAAGRSDTVSIGESLFQRHVLAFEVSSVLILVAIIGAIYLTKKRRPAAPDRSAPPAALAAPDAQAETPASAERGEAALAAAEPAGARRP